MCAPPSRIPCPLPHAVLTYSVIPTQHRLLWVDSVELVWVTYLSFYGQQQRSKLAEEAAAAGGGGPIITQVGWERGRKR